ncbi:MAG: methylmalonyl-CoA mutase family protein, partial [Candidatus Poseidoniia archaeon]|nr:methylmalonyl-CoA mutase family protein [Candidatus Poseidoniia archaeon]
LLTFDDGYIDGSFGIPSESFQELRFSVIIREEYRAKNDRSSWMRMIAGGGGGGLTKEQPENNIIRSAYYALISALSGTQTMVTMLLESMPVVLRSI